MIISITSIAAHVNGINQAALMQERPAFVCGQMIMVTANAVHFLYPDYVSLRFHYSVVIIQWIGSSQGLLEISLTKMCRIDSILQPK